MTEMIAVNNVYTKDIEKIFKHSKLKDKKSITILQQKQNQLYLELVYIGITNNDYELLEKYLPSFHETSKNIKQT